jgi:hypothetical protein
LQPARIPDQHRSEACEQYSDDDAGAIDAPRLGGIA